MNQLKVDSFIVPQRCTDDMLVVYTIDIPFDIIYKTEESTHVLERVKNLIVKDFQNVKACYHIILNYEMLNTEDGKIRSGYGFCVGSKPPPVETELETFKSKTFVDSCLSSMIDLVERRVAVEFQDYCQLTGCNKWLLRNFHSIVFKIQSKIKQKSVVAKSFPHNGKHTKKTFALP